MTDIPPTQPPQSSGPFPGAFPDPQQNAPGQGAWGQSSAPPQYSPDGRFYWNGAQWLPVQAPRSGMHPAAAVALGCVAAFFILAILMVVLLTVVGKQIPNIYSNISNGLYQNEIDRAISNY